MSVTNVKSVRLGLKVPMGKIARLFLLMVSIKLVVIRINSWETRRKS